MDNRLFANFFSFCVILAVFPALIFGSNDYRKEIPVKMLNVRSLATRYPASNSEFRTSIENGYVIWNSFTTFNNIFNLCFTKMYSIIF